VKDFSVYHRFSIYLFLNVPPAFCISKSLCLYFTLISPALPCDRSGRLLYTISMRKKQEGNSAKTENCNIAKMSI
jgi:hypothetical protein